MVNTTRGGGENRGEDSQDRLVVVHAGAKQGLDHSEGEFGALDTGGSILGLGFGGIAPAILDKGTAEQSNITTVSNKFQTKGNSKKMGKPHVFQLLRGFHLEGDLRWVIAPSREPTQIQGNNRGLIEPLGKRTKVKIVISMEIEVNQIGERPYEREK